MKRDAAAASVRGIGIYNEIIERFIKSGLLDSDARGGAAGQSARRSFDKQ